MTELDTTDETPTEIAPDEVADDRTSVLDITTELSPSKLFRVDGEEYELYNYDHLSPDQEATVTATFARFLRVYRKLEVAKNDTEATKLALKLRTYRMRLIELMTSIPHPTVNGLGTAAQGKLLTLVQNEISSDIEVDDDSDDDEDDIG